MIITISLTREVFGKLNPISPREFPRRRVQQATKNTSQQDSLRDVTNHNALRMEINKGLCSFQKIWVAK